MQNLQEKELKSQKLITYSDNNKEIYINIINYLNNKCNTTSGYVMLQESIDMAIKALEKQIPKRPRKTDSYRGMLIRVYAYACPTCGNACLEKYMNERQNTMFCWNCGQKLDWSDAE